MEPFPTGRKVQSVGSSHCYGGVNFASKVTIILVTRYISKMSENTESTMKQLLLRIGIAQVTSKCAMVPGTLAPRATVALGNRR